MISCTPRRGADQMIIKVSWGGGIKRRLPQANFRHRFAVSPSLIDKMARAQAPYRGDRRPLNQILGGGIKRRLPQANFRHRFAVSPSLIDKMARAQAPYRGDRRPLNQILGWRHQAPPTPG
jgi:hypothetical protein